MWPEYLLLMEVAALNNLDKEYDIHLAAYMTEVAGAKKQVNKKIILVYPTFKDFFDYDKRKQELLGKAKSAETVKLEQFLLRANSL